MIDVETRSAIWNLYKQGKTKRALSKLFELDKRTISKIIKQEGQLPIAPRKDKIAPDLELVKQVYKRCEGYARRTHEVLTQEYSVQIGYSTLNRFLAEIEAENDKKRDQGPPLVAKPGEFMQHDTSPHLIKLSGKPTLLQCAGLYFRFSKVRYIKYYRSFDKFEMKAFLHEALTFWKYVATTNMIDNTSLAVLRGTGPDAVFHDDMNALGRRCGFVWAAHPLRKPNWKAGKERNFWTVETNFIPGRTFKNMEDLNRQAFEWATQWYYHHPDDKTKLIPADLWEIEKPFLTAMPDYLEPPYKDYTRQADNNGYIPVYANYYWIPGIKDQEVNVVEYPGHIKIYRNRELLIAYPLKPCDVKYQQVAPDGYEAKKKPRHLHLTSAEEETKLRSQGETVVRYLEFIRSKAGAVRYRNQFVKNLYGISLRLAPGVFDKTIERALAFQINNCEAIERIAVQLMRADIKDWPEVATSDNFDNRESYLEGRLSAEPDLFSYAKLLRPTKNDSDGGNDNGSGSKNR